MRVGGATEAAGRAGPRPAAGAERVDFGPRTAPVPAPDGPADVAEPPPEAPAPDRSAKANGTDNAAAPIPNETANAPTLPTKRPQPVKLTNEADFTTTADSSCGHASR